MLPAHTATLPQAASGNHHIISDERSQHFSIIKCKVGGMKELVQLTIDTIPRDPSIRLGNFRIYCSGKARKYLERKIKQFANCYFHKGSAGECFLF